MKQVHTDDMKLPGTKRLQGLSNHITDVVIVIPLLVRVGDRPIRQPTHPDGLPPSENNLLDHLPGPATGLTTAIIRERNLGAQAGELQADLLGDPVGAARVQNQGDLAVERDLVIDLLSYPGYNEVVFLLHRFVTVLGLGGPSMMGRRVCRCITLRGGKPPANRGKWRVAGEVGIVPIGEARVDDQEVRERVRISILIETPVLWRMQQRHEGLVVYEGFFLCVSMVHPDRGDGANAGADLAEHLYVVSVGGVAVDGVAQGLPVEGTGIVNDSVDEEGEFNAVLVQDL